MPASLDPVVLASHPQCGSQLHSAHALLAELAVTERDSDAIDIAWAMHRGGWPWAELVIAALGGDSSPRGNNVNSGLAVWNKLPEWEDKPPETPPRDFPVEAVEARAQLVKLLGSGAEERPEQVQYAGNVIRLSAEALEDIRTRGQILDAARNHRKCVEKSI